MSSSLSVNNQICAEGCFAAAEEEIKASERSFYNRHLIIKRDSLCEREAEMVCRYNAIPVVLCGDWDRNRYPRRVSDSTREVFGGRG